MGLGCFGPNFYSDMQGLFVAPAVTSHWMEVQKNNLEKYKGKKIVVAGE